MNKSISISSKFATAADTARILGVSLSRAHELEELIVIPKSPKTGMQRKKLKGPVSVSGRFVIRRVGTKLRAAKKKTAK